MTALAFEELNPSGINIYGGPYYDADQYVGERMVPEVGQKVCLRDGREFVFVRVPDDDISVGAPVCLPLSDNAAFNVKLDVAEAASAGSKTVALDTTAIDVEGDGAGVVSAGYFEGGKLVITTGDAAGTYGIIASAAGTGAVEVEVTLDRPLPAALTTSNKAFVTRFDYYNAGAYAAANPVVLGFAVTAFTSSTNTRTEFGWVQTAGIGAVKIKTNTSIAIGSGLVLGDSAGLILEAAHAKQPLAISLVAAAQIADADVVPAKIIV